jgi:molybdopterin/thiamine biosynthesis adenylyltransferase
MNVKIATTQQNFFSLIKGLEWDDGKEKAALMLCHSSSLGDSIKLIPHKVIIPKLEDYATRSAGYYKLKKSFTNKVFNEAIELQSDVVGCHIHPGNPGIFSGIDAVDEPRFMRHIAEKIDGIYHGSLVFGNSLNSLDGWFYDRKNNQLVGIEKVLVIGRNKLDIFVPHRKQTRNDDFCPSLGRTILAFGKEAMSLVGKLDCGVVGASALGGPILEMLARDKVRSVMICDPDCIEETNLNRLPGATPGDIGRPKVEFNAERIKRISPEIEVIIFQKSFYDKEVQLAFSQADVVFGCVDSGARLSINRLALANLVPYFDLGASIEVNKGVLNYVGGQIYNVIPGRTVCLSCSGAFDHLLHEYTSPKDLEFEVVRGYIRGDINGLEPSVMYLDNCVAGLGYSEFLKYVLRRRDDEIFKVYYEEISNKLVTSRCSEAGCIACRESDFLGKGDKVPFMIPRKDDDFKFINLLEDQPR